MPHLLEIQHASFGYGDEPVIEDVDLAIDAGDFLAVAGPNGAGKTTLLRGMLGLIAPLAGRVRRCAGAIGYVPQREALDPIYPLTVQEVVHMGAYGRLSGLRRLGAGERQLAGGCLERVGLARLRRAPFSSLSGGQRQRVLIARALMARPVLLLLDEPTSGVDAEAVALVLRLLEELSAQDGLGVLVVTHQLQPLQGRAQALLWVDAGRVVRRDAGDMLDAARVEPGAIAGEAPAAGEAD